jgi:tRNA U54 and U55 pseudouridine synthase Pus10
MKETINMTNLCEQCRCFVSHSNEETQSSPLHQGVPSEETENFSRVNGSVCSVCLGLFSSSFAQRLKDALATAVQPYGGLDANSNNFISWLQSPPALHAPGDIIYRYHLEALRQLKPPSIIDFAQHVKLFSRDLITTCLKDLMNESRTELSKYPPCVSEEEQGHLCFHVLVLPRSNLPRPSILGQSMSTSNNTRKRSRKRSLDFDTQGGDPRVTLERKVQLERISQNNIADNGTDSINTSSCIWSINQAVSDCEAIQQQQQQQQQQHEADSHQLQTEVTDDHLDIYVAVWRRPFYLRGLYTKTRRDVSQTPFYVTDSGHETPSTHNNKNNKDNDNGNHSKKPSNYKIRLGVTSVEEQILPIVTRYCGGSISTLNQDPSTPQVHFGMAKFHASGREDMDVLMLLPSSFSDSTENSGNHDTATSIGEDGASTVKEASSVRDITGRPFVCEIIDALRLPSMLALQRMVQDINHPKGTDDNGTASAESKDDGAYTKKKRRHDFVDDSLMSQRSYGSNPMGVGIASDLRFVEASAFRNLQAETENKVKYYECLCWSQGAISNEQELEQRLCVHNGYPLEIHQKTPIRVLHRRCNMVRTRHILSAKVRRLDDHFFRLYISTDAGTCKL